MARIDFENAISFLTATVRIVSTRNLPLMERAPNASRDCFDRAADEPGTAREENAPATDQRLFVKTYVGLRDHYVARYGTDLTLQSFDGLAQFIEQNHPSAIHSAGVAEKLLVQREPPFGVLDYHTLSWLHSPYLAWPNTASQESKSTVLAFRTTNDGRPQTHWREFLLMTPAMRNAPYEEIAAVYDILGLQAQRRMLLSVNVQRRLLRVALPWGLSRFKRRDGTLSRPYMIVPVLTLLTRPESGLFRRSLTLTMFMLPDSREKAPLTALDLAGLCHQSVWIPARPPLPALVGRDGAEDPASIGGPLNDYIAQVLPGPKRYIHELFDAVVRRSIEDLSGDEPAGTAKPISDEIKVRREERIGVRIAVSRSKTAIFGTAAQFDGRRRPSIWKCLTDMRAADRAKLIGTLMSVHAGRDGRELLVDGDGLCIEQMRVSNAFESDTNALALYNPMSRFIVNINPKGSGLFTNVAINFGIAWLALLAGSVSTLEEILRSFRYEIEDHRSHVFAELRNRGRGDGDGDSTSLNDLHDSMLAILDELDVVYSLELVGQAYKAVYTRMLEMEGIPEERQHLLREFEIVADLLRAEEARELSRKMLDNSKNIRLLSGKIADSTAATEQSTHLTKQLTAKIDETTRNTDQLTWWAVIFAVVSSSLATNGIVAAWKSADRAYPLTEFWTTILVDLIVVWLGLVAVLVIRWRESRRGR